jgi:hypothetical protein
MMESEPIKDAQCDHVNMGKPSHILASRQTPLLPLRHAKSVASKSFDREASCMQSRIGPLISCSTTAENVTTVALAESAPAAVPFSINTALFDNTSELKLLQAIERACR